MNNLWDTLRNQKSNSEINAYREIVKELDPTLLLDYYGADNVYPTQGSMGTEYIHSCLIDRVDPHHSHGDQNPSASLQGENLLYNCWTYGGGDLFWLLDIMEEGNKKNILKVLQELSTNQVSRGETILTEIESLLQEKTPSFSIPHYSESLLKNYPVPHPALYEGRGIDPQVLLDFKVGFDVDKQEHFIPHFWQKKLVGWQRRIQDDPRWTLSNSPSKYKNSSGFPKEETLYGYDRVKGESVLVVESVMSVLKAHTYSRLVEGQDKELLENTICTFGAQMTQLQSEYLRKFKSVVLWYDNDKAGWKATREAIELLEPHTNVYLVDVKGQEDDLAGQHIQEVQRRLGDLLPSMLYTLR